MIRFWNDLDEPLEIGACVEITGRLGPNGEIKEQRVRVVARLSEYRYQGEAIER